MTLREKLNKIYEAIDFIPKNGYNKVQGYKFMKSVDVTHALRKQLIEHKIYAEINFEFSHPPYTIARKDAPNAPMSAVSVKCSIRFLDLESEQVITGSGLGTGADTGDKAAYKAQTGALKYALKDAFLVPDEADPEADETVDEQEPEPEQPRRNARPPRASVPEEIEKTEDEPPFVPSGETPAEGAAAVRDKREPGDEDSLGDLLANGALPTEAELQKYRVDFKKIADELVKDGKLKATIEPNLPVNRKMLVFLLDVTKAPDANKITIAQWDNFFTRMDAARAAIGAVGITGLVNKANGLDK